MTENKKKRIHLNIGTVIFGALFLYLIITVFLYLTASRISSYQVTAGPLSRNETYNALILRSEEVIRATSGGYVNYFIQDGSKAAKNGSVCSISNTKSLLETKELSSLDLSKLQSAASDFSAAFDSNHFNQVYDLKYNLNGLLLATEDSSLAGTIYTASTDGIVAYSCDGYEYLTQEELTDKDFQSGSYKKNNLRKEGTLEAGDSIYRLIKSETWSIVIPVTDRQTVRLASHSRIKVVFQKDGKSETGDLTLFANGDQRYVKITFDSGMIRYCNDRFLDVELVTNTRSGLKIPVSSIVTKEFYTIPQSLLTAGGETGSSGFLKEVTDKDGNASTSFVEATLYAKAQLEDQGDVYYVDRSLFQEGDVLIQPDSNTRYVVGATGKLEGVYCINKGYAVFRRIVIIDQNEEYCIVETGTSYGISQYDYIAREGDRVKEEQVLY